MGVASARASLRVCVGRLEATLGPGLKTLIRDPRDEVVGVLGFRVLSYKGSRSELEPMRASAALDPAARVRMCELCGEAGGKLNRTWRALRSRRRSRKAQ